MPWWTRALIFTGSDWTRIAGMEYKGRVNRCVCLLFFVAGRLRECFGLGIFKAGAGAWKVCIRKVELGKSVGCV